MRYRKYLTEAVTGFNVWTTYFKGKTVETYVKKKSPIFKDGINTKQYIQKGENITVPKFSELRDGKIAVLYKGQLVYTTFSNIDKQAKTGGEQLKIPSAVLTKSYGTPKKVTIGDVTFDASVFSKASDLADVIIQSLGSVKTVPDELKDIIIDYLESGVYDRFDWQGYDNKQHKNEVAKYLGELMIGLCALSNTTGILSKDIFGGRHIKEFIVPTDSSFKGVDSIFAMDDSTYVPISSKSGAGAPASFHANVLPYLSKNNVKTNNELMNAMISMYRPGVMRWLYDVAIKYLFRSELISINPIVANKCIADPYSVYKAIIKHSKGKANDEDMAKVELMNKLVELNKGKWKVTPKVKNGMPNAFTYFFCENIARKLNTDKEVLTIMLRVLASKHFWQANLNTKVFIKDVGRVFFKMILSGTSKMEFVGNKGTAGSVTSENGRMLYKIF